MSMTDNEIIKALECCQQSKLCVECPMWEKGQNCIEKMCGYAFDLIKRKNAKIEKCADTMCKMEDRMQLIAKERQQYYDELQTAKAEIENLSVDLNKKVEEIERLQKVQVEYVKAYFDEFVERLKNDISLAQLDSGLLDEVIDELVETMKNEFSTLADFTNLIRAEAIEKFVNRLKADIVEDSENPLCNKYPLLTHEYIDNLVKEMVGDAE